MDIDQRFQIILNYTMKGQPTTRLEIRPFEFFDEGGSGFSPDEWDCRLPWEELALEDYIPLPLIELRRLETIQLDIIDLQSAAHRKIVEQRWEGHRISSNWEDLSKSDYPSDVIVSILEKDASLFQIVKLFFHQQAVEVFSHNRFSENLPDEIDSSFEVPQSLRGR